MLKLSRDGAGKQSTWTRSSIIHERGRPERIVVDNGPEFAGRALDAWAYDAGVHLHFITPGRPTENAYIESFNGRFREKCLDEHCFRDIAEARATIENWRRDYNEWRPHSSIGRPDRGRPDRG